MPTNLGRLRRRLQTPDTELGDGHQPSTEATSAQQRVSHLQRQVGNQAVQRMLSVQRFSFENTNWGNTTEITRSTDGQTGVGFVKDGSDNPLVIKASNEPPRETLFASLFYNKLGKKRRISAPPIRVASTGERAQITDELATKTTDWKNDDDKQMTLTAYRTGSPNVWVQGMARGKSFGSDRKRGQGFTKAPVGENRIVELMENPDYARQMGLVVACDLFLGNADRIDAGNLGNWLTDESGAIALIDNFFSTNWQGLNRDAQDLWETSLAPDLAPSRFKAKGEEVYARIDHFVPEQARAMLARSFTMSPAGRKENFAKHFAKGMADGRSKILSKLMPKIGKRSRSMKAAIVAGEGGQAAWNLLKRRVRYMKNLK